MLCFFSKCSEFLCQCFANVWLEINNGGTSIEFLLSTFMCQLLDPLLIKGSKHLWLLCNTASLQLKEQ
ncbi:hypothetical protein RchiOBHm_Chr5g0049071 [Rosa chinensis]|uniref:Uncharacterized protein n=1 Tax=Rosa chinensis TaxID=74649 RepID=A0A2P6QER6_ROSCH|nr:hypothetical protein RchiOBHm_Chr5g0049071 [Rosa chinensis]